MNDMRTGEAIGKLKRIINVLEPFKHLEEVLTTAHAAEGVISSLNIEVDRLNKEVKESEGVLRSNKNDLTNLQKSVTEKRKKAAEEALTKEVTFKERLSKQEIDFKVEMNEKKKDLDRQIVEKRAVLKRMDEEILAATRELDTLKSSITKLKTQVSGLQPSA